MLQLHGHVSKYCHAPHRNVNQGQRNAAPNTSLVSNEQNKQPAALGASTFAHSALLSNGNTESTTFSGKVIKFVLDSGATTHFVNNDEFIFDTVLNRSKIGSAKGDSPMSA